MTSPVDTSVKFFQDDMVGAPVLTGQAGTLIGLLDACLVTGFGLQSVTSLVVSGGIATLTFSGGSGNPARPQGAILVAGVTDLTDLNGEQKVLSVSSTTVTFATAVADGTATGTITFKIAPLGWTKVYSGTNKAVYKPSAIEASSALLRVDDSASGFTANMARVRMFESMTDVDTGYNPAPSDGKVTGNNLYWWKSNSANTNAVRWTVVGDGRNAYFAPVAYSSSSAASTLGAVIYGFGDVLSYRSADAYCGVLFGETGTNLNISSNGSLGRTYEGHEVQLMRSHTGIGMSVSGLKRPMTGGAGSGQATTDHIGSFPAPANNGLFLSRIYVAQPPVTTYGIRGIVPGALFVPQGGTENNQFPRGTIVDGTGEFVGKKIYAVPQIGSVGIAAVPSDYAFFFDITGPWRN